MAEYQIAKFDTLTPEVQKPKIPHPKPEISKLSIKEGMVTIKLTVFRC